MAVGGKNIINKPIVGREKIILLLLYIKLGLMNQFLKALNKDGPCFAYRGKITTVKHRKTKSWNI